MSPAAEAAAQTWTAQDAERIAFWEEAARRLDWATPWHTAHSWQLPGRPGS